MMEPGEALGFRLWLVIIASCCLTAIPFTLAGYHVSQAALMERLTIPVAGIAIGRLLMSIGPTARLGGAIEGMFQMSFVALSCVMACYLAAVGGRPLVDAQLLRVDRLLGYDWLRYARYCGEHRRLHDMLRSSYYGAYLGPSAVALVLHLTERRDRYEAFVLAMMISSAVTVVIFCLFPATTAWTYLGQDRLAAATLADLPLSSAGWIGDLLRLRDGGGRTITQAAGLVAFPSYHCVMAIVYVWAAWPVKPLRAFFAVTSALTIASAPLIGGHYVADLIGGGVVALAAILLAGKVHAFLCGVDVALPGIVAPGRVTRRARAMPSIDAVADRSGG